MRADPYLATYRGIKGTRWGRNSHAADWKGPVHFLHDVATSDSPSRYLIRLALNSQALLLVSNMQTHRNVMTARLRIDHR
jgi:hypothetical protein